MMCWASGGKTAFGTWSGREPRNRARMDVVAAGDIAERFAGRAGESPRSADAG